jgi:hypothetical protein
MKNDWKQIFKFEQERQVVNSQLQPSLLIEQNPVMAIDIALELDATMIEQATAANARLLKVFPKGFYLGKTYEPHITILQRYIRTADSKKFIQRLSKF